MLLLGLVLVAAVACTRDDDTESAGDGGAACDFVGSTEVPEVEPSGGPFEISEVCHEVVQAGCEERLVFVFGSLPDGAEPGYNVSYREAPFRGPMGEIEVGGDALLEIVLLEASGARPSLTPPRTPSSSPTSSSPPKCPAVPYG